MPKNAEKPRVYMLLNRYLPIIGGAEMQAAQLSRELVRRGCAVTIITRRIRPELPARQQINGVPVRRLLPVGLSTPANGAIILSMIAHLVAHRRDYDVIHTMGLGPIAIAATLAGKLARKPVILRVSTQGDLRRENYEKLKLPLYRRLIRSLLVPPSLWNAMLKSADALIALSQETVAEAEALGLGRSLVLLPNGVDAQRFRPPQDEAEKMALREQLHLPPSATILLGTGRLVTRKRFDLAIKALKHIINDFPDCHLVLAGSAEHQNDAVETHLRALVEQSGLTGKVTFTGNVTNVDEYLRAADLYFFPSEREGMPNAILEAMAAGLPIVASRIGGVVDLLDDNTAWLFESGNEAACNAALRAALSAPVERQRRGVVVRQRVMDEFSLEAAAQRYEALYLRLMKQSVG